MPKILVASMFQETNDFHPNSTVYEDFRVLRGAALIDDPRESIAGAAAVFGARPDVELVPTYGAVMGAGGTVTQACLDRITTELLKAVAQDQAGVDGIYLDLHGAMAAEHEKDPEGYLLQQLRGMVGPDVAIVASFDMHGSITRRMLEHMDAATILHTYPHIDWRDTGSRAATVLLQILDGARPVIATVYTPTMVRGDELKTATGVHGTFIRHCERLERRADVLAAGIMLGHPPTDCPEQGSRVIIVSDGNAELAAREALQLGTDFWAMRARMQCVLYSVEQAIEVARTANGPVVFSDAADATSSGAPGTSNAILRGLLDSDYRGRVLLPMRDDPALEAARVAGIGATITVPLGGTLDPRFSPVQVSATVELLGRRGEIPIAVLRLGNITVFLAADGPLLCDRWMYSDFGQDPQQFDVIIQKLPHTPYEWYDQWAVENLTIDVPGAASPNIPTLGHQFVTRPIYPLDPDMTFEPQVEMYENPR
jgi:microcystin degradation protein MlrC